MIILALGQPVSGYLGNGFVASAARDSSEGWYLSPHPARFIFQISLDRIDETIVSRRCTWCGRDMDICGYRLPYISRIADCGDGNCPMVSPRPFPIDLVLKRFCLARWSRSTLRV
jgi:hypothetical protein